MKRNVIAIAIVTLAVAATAPALAQRNAAMTLIVHGIAGAPTNPTAPMDILLDGSTCLGSFEFGDILGPYPFEARNYDLSISPASVAEPCTLRPIIRTTVSFEPGEVSSLVAFVNVTNRSLRFEKFPVRRLGRIGDNGIVSLHHLAVSPSLDFMLETDFDPDYGDDDDDDDDLPTAIGWAEDGAGQDLDDDAILVPDMLNGDHVNAAVAFGKYAASVSPAGTYSRVIDPIMVDVEPNAVKFLFAIGSMRGRAMRMVEFNWPMTPAVFEALQAESDE